MKRFQLFIILLIVGFTTLAKEQKVIKRPKIVVGLVVDQMRWDYLYRYYNVFGSNGFRRLMNDGFNCQNVMINYLPSFTAPGHACIYTGSVPAIHGIAGNDWTDNQTCQSGYCVSDPAAYIAGENDGKPSMSPRNLLTTTITDELRLATNMRSRVYGVAIKDRSCILPAGHLANGAYWYNDKTGNFITSTYYKNQSPAWLSAFNKRKAGDSMLQQNWKLLYDAATYTAQSTMDANKYERPFKSERYPQFPHVFDSVSANGRYSVIKATPAGNTFTFMMARACMEGEQLGMTGETDFMAISLSSSDYVGHQFGTNSIETEDMYLRLDRDLADFLQYLDGKYGKDNYLFFMTADHGGAHNANFLHDQDVPAGVVQGDILKELNGWLQARFGSDSLVVAMENYQVYLNSQLITKSNGDRTAIKQYIMQWLEQRPEVSFAMDMENINATPVPDAIKTKVINGYNKKRSGVIQVILNPAWYDNEGAQTGTTHGSWNPYDTHIPLLWYGWGITAGETNTPLNMTDISATLAAMLHIQMPNGCIGKPIEALVK